MKVKSSHILFVGFTDMPSCQFVNIKFKENFDVELSVACLVWILYPQMRETHCMTVQREIDKCFSTPV